MKTLNEVMFLEQQKVFIKMAIEHISYGNGCFQKDVLKT